MTTATRELSLRYRWAAVALSVLLVASVAAGYFWGRGARLVTEDVRCLSAAGAISCTLDDGWTVSVPLDVPWTDTRGSFHEGGRPDCLPPTGRGEEGPVRVTWTKVEADQVGWRQVVWVGC